ncbi:MAG: Lrp/AsnC family transcriptional regulator [Candidatus Obscuribacterales bacterium]|nr:Lrp/AsnC family transcriptional regulator [Candidatus Obscuribacterales bacterium]
MKEVASDLEILGILQRDCRTPLETVARMIGKSLEETSAAIERLQAESIIKRYGATIDWEKIGIEKVVSFIDVKVQPAREVGFDAIAMRIARFPEVRSVWLVSGGSDLRIQVEADSLRSLGNFVAEKIATIDGVTGTMTQFIMRKYKEDHVMYNEPETDERLIVSP